MNNPRDTDIRTGMAIAQTVIDRLDATGTSEAFILAAEGSTLLVDFPNNVGSMIDWNKRACAYLFKLAKERRAR